MKQTDYSSIELRMGGPTLFSPMLSHTFYVILHFRKLQTLNNDQIIKTLHHSTPYEFLYPIPPGIALKMV